MLSGRSPADKRPLTHEPEVGRIAMGLCDSAMYIDGTELSGDRYCMEDAMYRVVDQRKCFVWCMGQPTAAAERLLTGGATSWIGMEMAVHEGLFEDHAENSSHESSQLVEPESELPQVESPESLITEDSAEDKTKADAGTEKGDAKRTDAPSIKVSVRFREQGELFE